MDDHELALRVAVQLATEHRHVGRQPGARADHQDVLAGGFVQGEDADRFRADVQPILDLQIEEPGCQLAAHDERQIELDVFVRAAFRRDRVGPPDHSLRIQRGLLDRSGLGVDGSLALGSAGHGIRSSLGRRQHARRDIALRLVNSRLGCLEPQDDVLARLELERQVVRGDPHDDQTGRDLHPTRHRCVVFSRHAILRWAGEADFAPGSAARSGPRQG